MKRNNYISLEEIQNTSESLVTRPSRIFIEIYLLTVIASVVISFMSIYYYL